MNQVKYTRGFATYVFAVGLSECVCVCVFDNNVNVWLDAPEVA